MVDGGGHDAVGASPGPNAGTDGCRNCGRGTRSLPGTAFGLYDVAIGATAFAASATAGLLWQASGAHAAFGLGACIAAGALVMLRLAGLPDRNGSRTTLPS